MEPPLFFDDASQLPPPDTIQWGWWLDVLMAITILLVLAALAMMSGQMAVFKAKAIGQMWAVATWRTTLGEHFALTGDWKISAGDLPRDFATARPDAIKWTSQYAAAGIVDGVIVTLGQYPGHVDGTAIVSYMPVVPKGEEHPTVLWLCGHAAAPAGWEGPKASPATNLPDDFLFSMCRRRSTG